MEILADGEGWTGTQCSGEALRLSYQIKELQPYINLYRFLSILPLPLLFPASTAYPGPL